jgi:glyoxylase-like metal-dependent hydrolase (beta-lactamase superfamily II)
MGALGQAGRCVVVGQWTEVGDGVLVVHYKFLRQNIGLIIGPDSSVVVDTRSSPSQAREIQADIQAISPVPIGAVINTHGHSDHVFGNEAFRPLDIWGHAGCVPFLAKTGADQRAVASREEPSMAAELEGLVIDPPNRLIERTTEVELGGRLLELNVPGRGHTDHDIVIVVPDAGVAFAGDLIVGSDAQFFGHSYPLDWPDALAALESLPWTVLITGHGGEANRDDLAHEIDRHRTLNKLASKAYAQGIPWEDLVTESPYPAQIARVALPRTYAQLQGAI